MDFTIAQNHLKPPKKGRCFDVIPIMMRITVTLPDDIYQVARSVAEAKDISLDDAIAESPITLEQTLAAEDAL